MPTTEITDAEPARVDLATMLHHGDGYTGEGDVYQNIRARTPS